MRSVKVGTAPMRECPACSSVFIGADTFAKLCSNREDRGSVAQYVSRVGKPEGSSISKKVRYVPCPVCAKVMNRVNFGHRSGVIIDVCKGHGAWLEHGELQDVLAFIDAGGLERDRAIQQEQLTMQQRMLEQERALGGGWVRQPGESFGPFAGARARAHGNHDTLGSMLDMIDFILP
ncbi:MAG: zf-TFIIB domain-containing protein [Gemmatimonadota bacterium]|nr:zf-TFIIB domain-containing protein [Gemmatimonadota bacterium]